MIFIAIFGFFIGELSDIKDDEIAGKSNVLKDKSLLFKGSILVITIIAIAGLTYLLNIKAKLYFILAVQLFCFILYSVPPFRLKKNKYASLLLDSLYSGTLMYFFVFSIGTQTAFLEGLLLFIWGFLRGQRNYVLHTIVDAKNDELIGIESIANTNSNNRILGHQQYIWLPLEVTSLLIFFYLLDAPFNFILMISYIFIYGYSYIHRSQSKIMSSFGVLSNINLFHEMLFPLITFLLLSIYQPIYIIPLILLIVIFGQYKEWGIAIFKKIKGK